ncbi:hypothetical protein [Caldicellulosiruptor bescii]|uniref:hypothetical protein n=1 Tax=Caldicellulosiruptor bescii TaxID=31899 RepID=UPI00117803EE|nr:hypothetical protein [Caldicellulosiruptor bescii]
MYSLSSKKVVIEGPLNVRGAGKCRDKPIKVMENIYLKRNEFKKYCFTVFIAFDIDVSEFSPKPPFDEKEFEYVKKALIKYKRIKDVSPIKVEKMIEDWFLDDLEGVYKYLDKNYKGPFKIPKGKDGFHKISELFKKYRKVYTKGDSCEHLINCLDLEIIIRKRFESLQKLLEIFGVEDNFKK